MARLLILPSPFPFTNPTWEILVAQLISQHGALGIGPRYNISCSSIQKVIREHGKFDALLCDPWFFFGSKMLPDEYRPKDILDCPLPIVVSLMQYDFHNLTEDFIARIKKYAQGAIVAACSHDFAYQPEDGDYDKEPWLNPGAYSVKTDAVFDYRFMLIPHCIGDTEFAAPIGSKRYDIVVPGAQYYFRKMVIEWVHHKPKIEVGNTADILQRVLARTSQFFPLGASLNSLNRPIGVELYRKRFMDMIAKSRVAVTCEGSINYPIRKFFEIPAQNTILAAKFFEMPERLGFIDGENCFSLTEQKLDDLIEIVEMTRSDSVRTNQMTKAGQEMVRSFHHVAVRAQQLRDICGAIASGEADTVTWSNGRPVFEKVASSKGLQA